MVKICETHFERDQIEMCGTRKELKIGAVPTLFMPVKRCQSQMVPRKAPMPRVIAPCVKYKNISQFLKQQIPKVWLKENGGDRIIYKLYDEHDQAKFRVDVLENFTVSASYYGWSAGQKSFIRKCNLQDFTACQLLNCISTCQLCVGVSAESDGSSYPHIITKQADPHASLLVQQSEIIVRRSATCDMFLEAYFSKMRQTGRSSEMRDINQYEKIIVAQKEIKIAKGSNVKGTVDWNKAQFPMSRSGSDLNMLQRSSNFHFLETDDSSHYC